MTSCGNVVLAYDYFWVVHGRLPTTADFTGGGDITLRLAQLKALISGSLRAPLSDGGSDSDAMTVLPLDAVVLLPASGVAARRAEYRAVCDCVGAGVGDQAVLARQRL